MNISECHGNPSNGWTLPARLKIGEQKPTQHRSDRASEKIKGFTWFASDLRNRSISFHRRQTLRCLALLASAHQPYQNSQCSFYTSSASTQYLQENPKSVREFAIERRWQEIPQKWQWPELHRRTREHLRCSRSITAHLTDALSSSRPAPPPEIHFSLTRVELYTTSVKTSDQFAAITVYLQQQKRFRKSGGGEINEWFGKRLEENALDGRWSDWDWI